MTVRSTAPTAAASRARQAIADLNQREARPIRLSEVTAEEAPRYDTHDAELNRVLGGGIVPGSLILLGGEPGIGKSTLLLQTILGMSERRILYVSGEESERQIKLRADRLQTAGRTSDETLLLCETRIEQIFTHIKNIKPELLVVDSIQTMSVEGVESSPGSVSQIRESATALLKYAKESGVPVVLIGHITK